MDEEIKKLLKSMKELGHKLKEDETLKKKERAKLEREWKLKNQELMNYLKKLEFKMRHVTAEGKTEESKKLKKEWNTIATVSYNSHPRIRISWDPFTIQDITEKVLKKVQEKKLVKPNEKKESSMTKRRYYVPSFYISRKEWQNDITKMKWFVRLTELAEINPDPKAVRTMLLAYKDYDEGRIDSVRLQRYFDEFKQSTKRVI